MNNKALKRRLNIGIALILACCTVIACCLINMSYAKDTAEADVISPDTGIFIKEKLLLDDYTTRTDGKVFNNDALLEIYERIAETSDLNQIKIIANTPKTGGNNIHSGLNSADIRALDSNVDNQNVVVDLGGMYWTVVSLSSTDSGDPILTLMLSDTVDNASVQWNKFFSNNSSPYSFFTYGSSHVRSWLLNGVGYDGKSVGYVASNNAGSLTTFTRPDSAGKYPFEIFNHKAASDTDKSNGGIADFLVQPKDVPYQRTQSMKDVNAPDTGWNCMPNEACVVLPKDMGWSTDAAFNLQSTRCYTDWGNDYLWSPSWSEIYRGNKGMWRLDNVALQTSADYWARTQTHLGDREWYFTKADGVFAWLNTSSISSLGVRPCIHLNLEKADSASLISLKNPKDENVVTQYTGNELTLQDAYDAGDAKWYNSYFASKVKVSYYDSAKASVDPIEPGDYTAKIEIADLHENFWKGGSTDPVEVPFKIIPKYIDFPTIDESKQEVYKGGKDIAFELKYLEDLNNQLLKMGTSYFGQVRILDSGTVLDAVVASPNGVTLDDEFWELRASAVRSYALDVELVDTQHYQWRNAPANRKLKFDIIKKKIYLELSNEDGSSTDIKGIENGKIYVRIEIDPDPTKQPDEGKEIMLTIKATSTGVPIPVATDIKLTSNMLNESREIITKLNLTRLRTGKVYNLVVETDSEEYEIAEIPPVTLLVEPKISNVLTWNLYANNKKQIGYYYDAQIGETQVDFDKQLTYDGKAYRFEAKLPTGYLLKTSEFLEGYEVVTGKGAANTKAGTNADTYTTKVAIYKETEPNNVLVYSINWEIKPVTFDLSGIKWQYNGELPYDSVNGSEAILEPKALPDGLIANYTNNSGENTVGTQGRAEVTFSLASGYEGNYVCPVEEDSDSYIDTNGEFEWYKLWTIVKAVIQSTSWKNTTHTDSNNKMFEIPVLRDPRADGGIVEYEYYETDQFGKIKDASAPLSADDIVWSESEAKFYVAKPILKNTDNYELDNDEAMSKMFRVGKDLAKVQVTLEKDVVEYNTNPRHAKLVVNGAALSTNAFDVTYYDGYTKLPTAPTEVGKYRVEVSLKASNLDKYQIAGAYEFDYEIVKGRIPIDWNVNIKPNVLKLNYGQINGVEYEIVNSEDIPVEYTDLVVNETYRIRAKIKNSQLNNFIFVDGSIETDWQEFEVTGNDKLVDPNDPNNPAYPPIDPDLPTDIGGDDPNPDNSGNGENDGNGEGNGDGNQVDFGKISDIIQQWWQVVASAISIVLIIIFTAKGIGYLNKSKRNKKAAEKYTSYYATATTGLFGLAMTSWTTIAIVLMVLAVVSFVFMLIAKSIFGKSQDMLQEAREDYNRNERSSDERRREDEYSRRDDEYRRRYEEESRRREEDMKMMFMNMLGGSQGMPQGGVAYQQQGIGAEDIRGIISDTVSALLPGVQQLLPQQASTNDEVVQKLIDQNERLIASASANDDAIKELIDQNNKNMQEMMEKNDERIERLLDKIMEMSAGQNVQVQPQVQVIKKEAPIEKVVEKVVEVPVEVIKEVPVEKIVEVPVEKVVEKIVEKEVKVHVPAPEKPKKEIAARLTLDEAYKLLSKQQQKYFDGLRQYALSKPNAKEKKSTYAITIGQSTVNPLLKLTIKKDMTVALFKMEDEYLKDIKRDASSDGTKVKVKETEVAIADAQACKVAKNMIDLREDQIERYQDLLKEQRATRNKK
ncbi:MAG: hypothetical protein K2M75_02670 [Clostridia bacterium]|nr:hypothetical protein [Clostridia bacterium]